MKVSEVMTTGLVTVNPEDTLNTAVQKMVMRRCGSLPVTNERGELVGIITIRDAMLPLYPNFGEYVHDTVNARDFEGMEESYKKVMCMKVHDVMTSDPMTVSPDDPVLKAASYMGLKNLRRIPVTDHGRLAGIISIGDISRGLYIKLH